MKRNVLIISGTAFILFIVFSCGKKALAPDTKSGTSTTKHYAKTSSGDIGFTFAQMGAMHNATLDYVLTTLAGKTGGLSNAQYADSLTRTVFPYLRTNYPGIFTANDSLYSDSTLLAGLNADDYYNGDSAWKAGLSYTSSHITNHELAYINRIDTIFNASNALYAGSTITRDSTFGYIIARLNAVISTFNSDTWNTGSDGDAAAGALYIALYSAQYWRTVTTYTDPPSSILRVDAAGYLFGWGRAWLVDQLDSPEARIHAGFTSATDWSAGLLASFL